MAWAIWLAWPSNDSRNYLEVGKRAMRVRGGGIRHATKKRGMLRFHKALSLSSLWKEDAGDAQARKTRLLGRGRDASTAIGSGTHAFRHLGHLRHLEDVQ